MPSGRPPEVAEHHTQDCSWPPLDLEPEVCFCLVHGEELPCLACTAPDLTEQLMWLGRS